MTPLQEVLKPLTLSGWHLQLIQRYSRSKQVEDVLGACDLDRQHHSRCSAMDADENEERKTSRWVSTSCLAAISVTLHSRY